MSSIREEESAGAVVPMESGWMVAMLSKRLRRLDMEAKALRRDVQNLERTQNSIAVTEDTQQRILARDSAIPPLPLPADLVGDLASHAGALYVVGNQHKELFDELTHLQEAAERAAVRAQEEEGEYLALVELLGGEDENAAAATGLRNRNAYVDGLRTLTALYLKREGLRNILDAQTEELAKLVAMEEETARTTEQRMEAEQALIEKLQQLSEQRIEKRRLENAVHRGEWTLQRRMAPPLEERVRHAVMDRQIASAALEKASGVSKVNEMSAHCRATRILLAEKRLEMIAETISGGLENEEPVDVDAFNAVMKEIDALRVLRMEGDYQMVCLDRDVEDISYRTNAIQHITISTQKEKDKIQSAHARYMALVQRDLQEKQSSHEAHIEALREEIAALRRKRRLQFTSNAVSGTRGTPAATAPKRSASAGAGTTRANSSSRPGVAGRSSAGNRSASSSGVANMRRTGSAAASRRA